MCSTLGRISWETTAGNVTKGVTQQDWGCRDFADVGNGFSGRAHFSLPRWKHLQGPQTVQMCKDLADRQVKSDFSQEHLNLQFGPDPCWVCGSSLPKQKRCSPKTWEQAPASDAFSFRTVMEFAVRNHISGGNITQPSKWVVTCRENTAEIPPNGPDGVWVILTRNTLGLGYMKAIIPSSMML